MDSRSYAVFREDGSCAGTYTDAEIASKLMRNEGAGACVVQGGRVLKRHGATTEHQRKKIEYRQKTGAFLDPSSPKVEIVAPAPERVTARVEPVLLCTVPGCTELPLTDSARTPDAYRGKCQRHRKQAGNAAYKKAKQKTPAKSSGKKPAAKKSPAKPYAKARAAKVSKAPRQSTPVPTAAPSTLVDQVTRSFAVIERMGGVDRAERVAALVERFVVEMREAVS